MKERKEEVDIFVSDWERWQKKLERLKKWRNYSTREYTIKGISAFARWGGKEREVFGRERKSKALGIRSRKRSEGATQNTSRFPQ